MTVKNCSASLAIENYVKGVFSCDTDTFALGVPETFTEFGNEISGQPTINATSLSHILTDLKLTNEQLVDLCIMSGCDNNTKLKGLTPLKSFNELKVNGSFEEIKNKNLIKDIDLLNYELCKEIFCI